MEGIKLKKESCVLFFCLDRTKMGAIKMERDFSVFFFFSKLKRKK